jgi:uncharacterized protein YjgD (DUF1641 family)
MKKALLIFLVSMSVVAAGQTDFGFYLQDIKVIPSDYATVSATFNDEKKETLRIVRHYIEGKEEQQSELEDKMDIIDKDRSMNMIDTLIGAQYLSIVDSASDNELIDARIKHLLIGLGYYARLFGGEKKISDISAITEAIRKKVAEVKKDDGALAKMHISKKNIADDINKAQLRIDSLYENLYDDGKFKVWITGIFSSIVGALLILFFVFISRKSETNLAKDFLSSGNGLQFITLFSLIIAIILFGVLGVLEGRELAAILSGISGYILGKGIQRPTDNANKNVDKQ